MPNHLTRIYFLPGLDGTGELFAGLVERLSRDLEICIVRYSKHEERSYDELVSHSETIIQTSEPFAILAESFSAPIAIRFAAQNPSNLKGLILCAGFARSPIRGLRRLILRRIAPMLLGVTPPGWMVQLLLVGCGAPRSLVASVQSAVRSVQRDVIARRLNSVLNCDFRGEVDKIKVPMLYLRARHDRIVSAACGREIVNLTELCRIAEIEGPHLLLQRNPIECAKAIMQFIGELPC